MVHVALVREDILAHTICTVPVVSRPVAADHHRHHSLESEHAEVPFVQIADAISLAVYLRFSPSLHHQMAKELQAILAVIQEVQEVLEVQEMVDLVDQRERQDHQRNENFTAEKSCIGLQDQPSRQLVLNGSSRGVLKQEIHHWPHKCRNFHRGCLEATNNTGSTYSVRNHVEERPYAMKFFLQLPMGSRDGSIVSLSPKTHGTGPGKELCCVSVREKNGTNRTGGVENAKEDPSTT